MPTVKKHIIQALTRKYIKAITTDCIEFAPKIEDAFEIRSEVLKSINKITKQQEGR